MGKRKKGDIHDTETKQQKILKYLRILYAEAQIMTDIFA